MAEPETPALDWAYSMGQQSPLARPVPPSMTAYDPTIRDRIGAAIAGDERNYQRQELAKGIMGSSGIGPTGMGLVDVTPAGLPLAAEEVGRQAVHDPKGAAVQASLMAVPGARGVLSKAGKKATKELERMPQLAERYPEMVPPEMKPRDNPKPGQSPTYPGKVKSGEEKQLEKLRTLINKDVRAGKYQPYFDPEKRYDVNKKLFPPQGETIKEARPAKQATWIKHEDAARRSEGVQRLKEAFERGRDLGGADRWYQMGQVHEEFRKVLGAEAGDRAFKDWVLNIAGTTAGASPEGNLLMAHYARYARAKGLPPPNASYEMPYPTGGTRFGPAANVTTGYEMSAAGEVPAATNPKRHNFAYNFMGHENLPTLDEQMGKIWTGKESHFGDANIYAPHETVLNELAASYGVSPREFQEVAWAGHKNATEGYMPKPFIQTINEAIERTHRVTGMPHKEIVERGLVKGEIPLYAVPSGIGLGAASQALEQQQGEGPLAPQRLTTPMPRPAPRPKDRPFTEADRADEMRAIGRMGETMQRGGVPLPGPNDPLSENVEDRTKGLYPRAYYQNEAKRKRLTDLIGNVTR